jgi:AraC-like DNA-binding protein
MIQSVTFSHRRTQTATHYHDCHEIIFITKGTAQLRVNGHIETASQGDIVIFSRFEEHSVASRTADYRRYVLQITPDIPAEAHLAKVFSILFNRPEQFCNVLHCAHCAMEISGICQQLLQEQTQGGAFCNDMLNLLIQQLLILLCRQMPHVFAAFSESAFETVQQLQRRLERDYRQSFTLSQLAIECGFSVSYLSHLFKRITGSSIMGYLQSCRMAAAKKYLVETPMEIGTIVESCGFSDASNFSRAFRSLTGSTPTQFRQQYRR